jgi:hypothetical protein
VALVSEPDRLPRSVLEELVRSMRAELEEVEEMVTHPRGNVLDPESLRTAQELLEATRRMMDRAGPRTPTELADEANLAYAAVLSILDLVKSHTDVPKVPLPRKSLPAEPGGSPPT